VLVLDRDACRREPLAPGLELVDGERDMDAAARRPCDGTGRPGCAERDGSKRSRIPPSSSRKAISSTSRSLSTSR